MVQAWLASPQRFREDANAEEALALGGYAGRAVIELVANAVDAAAAAGEPARVRIELGPLPPPEQRVELRVANTGAALTAAGVAALASLRASAKRDESASVGRFGVGFTAVLSVADAVRVVSRDGVVRFGADLTTAEIAGRTTALDAEIAARGGGVPILRLPFGGPVGTDGVPAGFVTQVRLTLRPDVVDAVRAELAAAPDELFWALPGLEQLEIIGSSPGSFRRVDLDQQSGAGLVAIEADGRRRSFRTVSAQGELPAELLAGRPIEERSRTHWRISWVIPSDGAPSLDGNPAHVGQTAGGTIGAPTPTDEPLSVPARLIGTFPVDDTRRHLAPGPVLDLLLAAAARSYGDLVLATPEPLRHQLVPAAGFPAGQVDGRLRELIMAVLQDIPMLLTADGEPVSPRQAVQVRGLDRTPNGGRDAAAMVVQAVPGMIAPPYRAAAEAIRVLQVRTVELAEVTSALSALDRPAQFWAELYPALDGADLEDLGDLPVPLVGGGLRIGARGCLLPGSLPVNLLIRAHRVAPRLPLVDPGAADALLERLGAQPADAAALAAAPELVAAYGQFLNDLEDLEDTDPDPADVGLFAGVALDLAGLGAPAGVGVLGHVVLTAEDEPWPATELCLPGAPWADLLEPDDRPPLLDARWTENYGAAPLLAAGVRFGLRVVTVPTGPGAARAIGQDGSADTGSFATADQLPDFDRWWDDMVGEQQPPDEVSAIADLDLVADQAWPLLLTMIAADREALATLTGGPTTGYTGWYLGRHALIDGLPLRRWRTARAFDLAGLYDVLPVPLDDRIAAGVGVLTSMDAALIDPAELVARYADPARQVPAAMVATVTALVVTALTGNDDLDLPDRVRTITGNAVRAADCLVLDGPWWAGVVDAGGVVPGGSDPRRTADVLEVDLASDALPITVRATALQPIPAMLLAAALRAFGLSELPAPTGTDRPELRFAVDLAVRPGPGAADYLADPGAEVIPVLWWVGSEAGKPVVWVDGSAAGIGRAVAFLAGRWEDRAYPVAAAARDWAAVVEAVDRAN